MTDIEVPAYVKNESASPHAVFIDIDGTLCDSCQWIPGSALEVLAQARNRGHLLFACTGRSVPEVYTRFWDVGLEGLVGGAGGYASVGDRVFVDECTPCEHVGMLTALRQELDAFHIRQGPDQMGPSKGHLNFFVLRAGKYPEDWIEYAQSITLFITGINSGVFTKVTAYVLPEKVLMERVTAALPDGYRAIIGSVGIAGYVPFEVVPVHLSKAAGIRAICEHVGILLSYTVALGDSNNDIEAVATAAVGISIGDDCRALISVADIVAPSASEDGLAWTLRATGLTLDDPSGGQGLGDVR